MVEDKSKDRAPEDTSPDASGTTDPTETVAGQSFYNQALTGSGTITVDGTYAEPLPDPTQIRGLGPDRTAGGRRVLSGLDPDARRVAEVTEAVAGVPADTREGFRADKNETTEDSGTARRSARSANK
jgi:hypothetical protein